MLKWLGWIALVGALWAVPAEAEDGYDLWLRYRPLPGAQAETVAAQVTSVVHDERDPTIELAATELTRGLSGLTGRSVAAGNIGDGAIVIGTASSARIAALRLPLQGLGREGFVLRSVKIDGKRVTVVAANSPVGVLYGAFRLLRIAQTTGNLAEVAVVDRPGLGLRMLNHWDNLDRYVERGYAGRSLWDWQKLPGFSDPRYTDYARANASVGINGTVLNNVNASADILKPEFLGKIEKLAGIFRPWGIKVYVSARFSAPIEIGGLKTADPLDPQVAAWWKAKADEIYARIPDFGGFLVKANSEGQPGPGDYKRSHADGANMLAAAVKPHGGIVMWRAFVYANEKPEDRVRQAYSEFEPLDGKFADNVIVQVKNGPIDFQPREPFHPLFGAMPRTPLMMEVQITKEYMGFATHLVYLGTMWQEVLRSDTYRPRKGTTVADVLDTPVRPGALTGMAGVSNIGTDRNWSGSQFDQANWYAFGRLAWNPDDDAREIARDWAAMTWGRAAAEPIVAMMMRSHEAVVDYMMPLGLNHLFATGHHYGPGPWVDDLAREDWNPVYFHKADRNGIGFDRTPSGSNAASQYGPVLAKRFSDPKAVPENLLLWFHHMSWDRRMASGRTLWAELVAHYDRGVAEVAAMQAQWAAMQRQVDAERFAEVSQFLAIQRQEAQWWRDACIAYFAEVSGRPIPAGVTPPPHPASYYKAIRTPWAPGNGK
ncbi:alpha-glucuronidase family glycosyl hydrolase [Sphingomonas sp. Leaf10]|uniref:alpha-glucuronidase family glycosyl hydrolase n=1 Tax=Sphingomonas sp. Leaf10 TaxID=1735676 RepID=UPI0006F8150D|nr:alpha-glucuronidase family glycosyl hydrolase [Sphingomonas sp. Leaf10]KQM41042.1 alpha-glucuronidase [Sphingomonas sp. Leaf10]